jgi:hypothetical protein
MNWNIVLCLFVIGFAFYILQTIIVGTSTGWSLVYSGIFVASIFALIVYKRSRRI